MHGCFPYTLGLELRMTGWFVTILHACSEIHDMGLVAAAAGFDIRNDEYGLQDLCALLLRKRFKFVQERYATAASVSRDIAIKLAPLWLQGACQDSTAKVPTQPPHTLSDHDIQKLPPVNCNAEIKVILNAAEERACVQHMLGGLRDAGGNVRRVVAGFDVKFVAAGALARTEPFPQLQLPTVIQACLPFTVV